MKWIKICKSKKNGGLGIKNLRKMNISLLTKWWWKLERDGLWQEIVKFKYLKKNSIFSVSHKTSDSPIWADLLKVKDIYLQGGIRIRYGHKRRFLSDTWLYDVPICNISSVLFILCEQKNVSVADVKSGKVQISFSRWLTSELQTCWNHIVSDAIDFHLQEPEDEILWKFGKNKHFSVKSMYNAMTKDDVGPDHKHIGRVKFHRRLKSLCGC